jgi:hypothetical protein
VSLRKYLKFILTKNQTEISAKKLKHEVDFVLKRDLLAVLLLVEAVTATLSVLETRYDAVFVTNSWQADHGHSSFFVKIIGWKSCTQMVL